MNGLQVTCDPSTLIYMNVMLPVHQIHDSFKLPLSSGD